MKEQYTHTHTHTHKYINIQILTEKKKKLPNTFYEDSIVYYKIWKDITKKKITDQYSSIFNKMLEINLAIYKKPNK